MKTKQLLAFLLSLVLAMSLAPITVFATDTVVIPIDSTTGIPRNDSGDGWTYDSNTNILILESGSSYSVENACRAEVINNGTIEGGIYKGRVTNNRDAVINGGTFYGGIQSKFLSTINDAYFPISFETNGGIWNNSDNVPTVFSYKNGLTLPTNDDITKDGYVFDGWYEDSNFQIGPTTSVPEKKSNSLKYYARFIPENTFATWEDAGASAQEFEDYTIDADGNYTVKTAKGLAKIANVVNSGDNLSGKTVTLENDIDLLNGNVYNYSSENVINRNSWLPINGFSGTFDGNNKKIFNLYIASVSANAGLFDFNSGVVKDLEIASGSIKSSTSAYSIGGICSNLGGSVENCISRVNILVNVLSGDSGIDVGGIAGLLYGGRYKISNCQNYGTVRTTGEYSGNIVIGGIVGSQNGSSVIDRCTNHGSVSLETTGFGARWAGGIAGQLRGTTYSLTTLKNSCNYGAVGGVHAGGIVGLNYNYAILSNCYNVGNVKGGSASGGIVGRNSYTNIRVENCYNRGTIEGSVESTLCGGIIGDCSKGRVSGCFYLKKSNSDTINVAGKTGGTLNNCTYFLTSQNTHTLESEVNGSTDLLTSLNNWVTSKEDADYSSWIADSLNNNYPKFAERVVITAENKTHTFDNNAYDVSQLFQTDSNAGAATYSVVSGGTGEGTLQGSMLTVNKAGTFYILLKTAPNGNYSSGSATAVLTVEPKIVDLNIPLSVPVKNSAVVNDIHTSEYDATVTWEPQVNSTYASNTVYTATVTITLKNTDNYTVNGVLENEYRVLGATSVTNIANSNTLAVVFPQTEADIVTSGTPRYIVSFDSNGGTTISDKTIIKGNTVYEPATPKKDGYVFDGWYKDKALTQKYNFNEKVKSSFTLYAKWVKNEIDSPDNSGENNGEPGNKEWSNPFSDVSNYDWFFESVKYVNENGFMNGTTKTTFEPNLPLTRGMFVTILYRMAGEPTSDINTKFSDVASESYYEKAVTWAIKNNIITGFSQNEFAPDENITREQMAVIIYRYAVFMGIAPKDEWAIKLNYSDVSSISDYAVEGVMYCTLKGIMEGVEQNIFDPKTFATRAQVSAIVQRLSKLNK